ncbi:DUF6049 family protein [Nonomuraea glycinis]|uniref:Secreted protein n=1 Tax=Nonomuraea glycinis TaxID=2047744 RepID=A0A918A0K6_9ACTN|nr:DUF6049 family protein [Nonomuraea glycinis]MCA2176905.1 DUF6049 family protein [Nonomuraea glycinis]GGP03073.1 hypothetical protein GCM10012278_12830 [Nonomuraea glycinis]
MIRKAALLAVLSAALFAPTVATAPGEAAAITSRQGVNLTLATITPDYATERGTEIKVTGTVHNAGTAALPGLRVRVRYDSQRFADRAAMSAFQADQTTLTQPRQVSTQSSMVLPELGAGASQPFELTMTPAQFGLTAFGAYPLAVEVVQWDAVQLASQRTFLTYAPPTPQPPVRNRLAFVLPIIDQPHRADEGTFVDTKLSAAMTGKGRLATLARIAEAAPPSVTWVIDPAVFDDADAMAKEHTLSTKGAKQKRPADNAASQWLTSVRTSLADNPVMATPYADPDVTALAHQGLDDQTGLALELGAQKARQLVKPDVGTSTYWPAGGRLDADALDLLAVGKPNVAKVDKVLLDAANLPPQTPATTTPDAATTIDTVMGPITALTADAELSRTLEEPSGTAGSTLLSRQRFIAETAMISAEPGQIRPRSLVIAPSRRWNPSPTLVTTLLKTAGKLPWLRLTPLDSIKPGATQVPRAGLTYTAQDRKQELGAKYLARVKETAAKARLTGLVTGRPQPEFDAAVLRLSSSAWRGGQRAGRAIAKLVDDAVTARINKVSITGAGPDRPRTLAGRDGDVPISVKNSLDGPISLYIEVKSNNPELLQVAYQQPEPLPIGSGQSGTVQVPMTASPASGDATVTVQLLTTDRTPYGAPVKLIVRTTGYTGIALVIVGAALTVMLAAVVTRVLRRRSQRRTARAARARESETV